MSLLHRNLVGPLLVRLGHLDVEHALVELGLDLVLIDAGRETEDARELAKRPLADPVFGRRGLALALVLGTAGMSQSKLFSVLNRLQPANPSVWH